MKEFKLQRKIDRGQQPEMHESPFGPIKETCNKRLQALDSNIQGGRVQLH